MTKAPAMLPDDASIPFLPADYCSWGEPLWYAIPAGEDRGKRLFYCDRTVGRGGESQTVLFVHGNPECSYIFRRVITSLLEMELPLTRLVTMDHIGFGLSSRAARPMTPLHHAGNLSQLLAHLAPRKVILVLHDWGGPIGLAALLDRPEQLSKLLILNSAIFPLSSSANYHNHPFPLLSWTRLASLVPDRFWGTFAAGAITSRAGSRAALLAELLRYPFKRRGGARGDSPYRVQFASAANVASSKHLALLAGNWGEPGNDDCGLGDFYARLQDEVKKVWGPCGAKVRARLMCGEWDPLGERGNARQWLRALPQLEGEMTFFPGCGHFIAEVRPVEIARAIFELLREPL